MHRRALALAAALGLAAPGALRRADRDPVRRQQLHLRPGRPGAELQRRQRARPHGRVQRRQLRRLQSVRAASVGRRARASSRSSPTRAGSATTSRSRRATRRRCAGSSSTPPTPPGICAATSPRRSGTRSCCRNRATPRCRRAAARTPTWRSSTPTPTSSSASSTTARRRATPRRSSTAAWRRAWPRARSTGTCNTPAQHPGQHERERGDQGLRHRHLGASRHGVRAQDHHARPDDVRRPADRRHLERRRRRDALLRHASAR